VAACGGESAEEGTSTPATTAQAGGSEHKIVGEWKRKTTCAELVQALRSAGMDEVVDEFVAGNGFIPGVGVDDPEQIDVQQPCKGAVPRVHSHFFTPDGEFGSRDWNGQDVDDGHYRVIGDRLVISKEFPEVTFRFRIEGDAIMFEPLTVPRGCTTFRCACCIAVAYPGREWNRVG
jgi:LSD1 subclass zinc finger protein